MALALAGAVAVPGPAAAAPRERIDERFAFTDSFEDCGMRFEVAVEGRVTGTLTPVEGGQAFLQQAVYRVDEHYTTDRGSFRIEVDVLTRELSAEHLGDDVYLFDVRDTGRVAFIGDSGRHVHRDSGGVDLRVVFDTLGDGQPGGDVLDVEVVGTQGRHPALDLEWCDLVEDLLAG